MANQPLLRNWSQKLPNLAKSGKIMAIMLFKVTNFGTSRKPICDFLLVITSYPAPFPSYGQLLVKFLLLIEVSSV